MVAQVVEVEIEAGQHFLQGVGISVVEGRVARDPGTDLIEVPVSWIALHDTVYVELPLRAVSDEGHVPPEDVPELWKLVKVMLAQEFAHAGQARVVVAGVEARDAHRLGIPPHGAELEDAEWMPAQADSLLGINNGTAVLDEDGQRTDDNRFYAVKLLPVKGKKFI